MEEEIKGKPADYLSHLYFGGFICLLGLGLLLVALSGLPWWEPASPGAPEGLNLRLVAGFAEALAGVGLVFLGLHAPAYLGDPATRFRFQGEERAVARWKAGLLTVMLGALLTALAFQTIRSQAEKQDPPAPQPASFFALTLPLPAVDPPANSRTLTPPAPPAQRDAVMFWDVPKQEVEKYPGLLPMLVASLLTIGFGLAYPRIALSGDEEGKGFIQKLILPALSMILFGVGAGERVNAESTREDVRLVAQGLPPVIGMPAGERRAYTVQAADISAASNRNLQQALNELMAKVATLESQAETGKGGDTPAARTQEGIANLNLDQRRELVGQIRLLRAELRRGTTISDAQSARLARETQNKLELALIGLQDLNTQTAEAQQASAQLSADERRQLCELFDLQMRVQDRQIDPLVQIVRRQDEEAAENIFKRAWAGLVGRNQTRRQGGTANPSSEAAALDCDKGAERGR